LPAMSVYARRRLVAVLVAALASVVVWLIFIRDSGGDDEPQPVVGRGVSDRIAGLVGELTPAERVDEVLLLGFEGTDATAPLLAQLGERQLGGVLLGARNWQSADQLAALAAAIRAAGLHGQAPGDESRRIPPLIVAAQEGGAYRSFPDLPPELTQLEVGEAREAAEALRAAGLDLNLAPLADVATADSHLAERSFSDDPALAAALTAAAVRGCRAAKLACAVPHFPGLGAASQDTNQGPATVSLDVAALDQRDLEAFRAAIAERVPAVVLSLAFYAAYDPVTPAALAAPVATDLLRGQLGFEGLAITDDLGAGAIRAGYSVPDAAVAALQAGADMVRIDSPEDQAGVRPAMLEAAESGAISEERLAEAAGRVLQLKLAGGLLEQGAR
jgi:beta-N-acetylhexosaminidase